VALQFFRRQFVEEFSEFKFVPKTLRHKSYILDLIEEQFFIYILPVSIIKMSFLVGY